MLVSMIMIDDGNTHSFNVSGSQFTQLITTCIVGYFHIIDIDDKWQLHSFITN